MKKKCTRCKIPKPTSSFGKNRTTRDGLACECKDCYDERMKKYRGKGKNDWMKVWI